MPRKGNLPSLDQCVEPTVERSAIPAARFIEAIWVMVVLAGLGVAHIHLCFQMTDMRLQHKHLQAERKILDNKESRLERQMVGLPQDSSLEAFAETLGMRRLDLAQQSEAKVISVALQDKYLGPSVGTAPSQIAVVMSLGFDEKSRSGFLQRAVFAFLDSGNANAGENF